MSIINNIPKNTGITPNGKIEEYHINANEEIVAGDFIEFTEGVGGEEECRNDILSIGAHIDLGDNKVLIFRKNNSAGQPSGADLYNFENNKFIDTKSYTVLNEPTNLQWFTSKGTSLCGYKLEIADRNNMFFLLIMSDTTDSNKGLNVVFYQIDDDNNTITYINAVNASSSVQELGDFKCFKRFSENLYNIFLTSNDSKYTAINGYSLSINSDLSVSCTFNQIFRSANYNNSNIGIDYYNNFIYAAVSEHNTSSANKNYLRVLSPTDLSDQNSFPAFGIYSLYHVGLVVLSENIMMTWGQDTIKVWNIDTVNRTSTELTSQNVTNYSKFIYTKLLGEDSTNYYVLGMPKESEYPATFIIVNKTNYSFVVNNFNNLGEFMRNNGTNTNQVICSGSGRGGIFEFTNNTLINKTKRLYYEPQIIKAKENFAYGISKEGGIGGNKVKICTPSQNYTNFFFPTGKKQIFSKTSISNLTQHNYFLERINVLTDNTKSTKKEMLTLSDSEIQEIQNFSYSIETSKGFIFTDGPLSGSQTFALNFSNYFYAQNVDINGIVLYFENNVWEKKNFTIAANNYLREIIGAEIYDASYTIYSKVNNSVVFLKQ